MNKEIIKTILDKMLEEAQNSPSDDNEMLAIEDCLYANSLSNTALTEHILMWQDFLGNESVEEVIYQRKIIEIKKNLEKQV